MCQSCFFSFQDFFYNWKSELNSQLNKTLEQQFAQQQRNVDAATTTDQHRPNAGTDAETQDITNTHFRYFFRLLSSEATLYTEMIHYNAIMHNAEHHLPFHPVEHPVVLQLGGSNPKLLAEAALLGKKFGYDEINLNVGCPSPRVQEGSFGACLMKEKNLVAECMKAMRDAVNGNDVDCTVKCRLGVDQFDSYDFVKDFIQDVSTKGNVKHFIIHARKAYLKGLNPAQNRNIPPLRYELVYKLTEDFPDLQFSINGGVKTLEQAHTLLSEHPKLVGCMIGRTAYENPYQMVLTDQLIYGKKDKLPLSRYEVLDKYAQYVEDVENNHNHINGSVLVKPAINLFYGQRCCAKYRQILSDPKRMKQVGAAEVLRSAREFMYEELEIKRNSSDYLEERQEKHEIIKKKSEDIMIKKESSVQQQVPNVAQPLQKMEQEG